MQEFAKFDTTPPMTDREVHQLNELVDKHGLTDVVWTLHEICHQRGYKASTPEQQKRRIWWKPKLKIWRDRAELLMRVCNTLDDRHLEDC